MERQHSSKLIQHLGIIAGVCKEIRLAELIDRHVDNGGRKVTVGEAAVAMVLNAMGFTGRPLYLTPRLSRNCMNAELPNCFSRSPHRYSPIRG